MQPHLDLEGRAVTAAPGECGFLLRLVWREETRREEVRGGAGKGVADFT